MTWKDQLKGDSLAWLLEKEDPAVRYLALRDLMDLQPENAEMRSARKAAHQRGPIATVLDHMDPEGFWGEPGPGYLPKYKSTIWSIILLAQLGAQVQEDERIFLACNYLLESAYTEYGQFTMTGAPSGTVDCLQGNLLWALLELGFNDARLEKAVDWMARGLTGEGIAPMSDRHASLRYYAGKCGPVFACGANNKLPCAWGGAKVMLGFSILPASWRTPLVERAIRQGIDYFFSVDLAKAEFPSGYNDKPSGNWWKFGFPVFYVTDLLQVAEALVGLGCGSDPRLAELLALIRGKQDENGRWALEYDYSGRTWVDFGTKKQPNKWVTLRALRVLKSAWAG